MIWVMAMNDFNSRKRHAQYIKDFNRTVGYYVANFLFKYSSITANQLTFFRIVIGLIAGVLWTEYFSVSYGILIGGILLQLSSTLDAADGDLAALRGRSKRGAWLDTQTDLSLLLFVFLCLSFRYAFNQPYDMILISNFLSIDKNIFSYISIILIMYSFALMLLLKIVFNQRGSVKILGEEFQKQYNKNNTNSSSSKSILTQIKLQISPSPSFYYPVLFIFSIFDYIFYSIIFLSLYLTFTIMYVQIKTYIHCIKLDKS